MRKLIVSFVMAALLSQSLAAAPQLDCHSAASSPALAQVADRTAKDGMHTKTVVFKNILVDKIYPSMQGPSQTMQVQIGTARDQYVWITGYRAEVLDGKNGSASQEFMCHSGLTGVTRSSVQLLVSIAQGQKQVTFPPGYALRFPLPADRTLQLVVQVLNNNYAHIHRLLDFKTTIQYYGDAQARKLHLIPLRMEGVFAEACVDPKQRHAGETVVRPCPQTIPYQSDGRTMCNHWLVPPGREVVASNVTQQLHLEQDTSAHYIWMHVHPYAESVELRDDTLHHTVWRGNAVNAADPARAQIMSTDSYCGTHGLPLAKGHRYTFISTYRNRSQHDVDAMASMWLFVRDSASDAGN